MIENNLIASAVLRPKMHNLAPEDVITALKAVHESCIVDQQALQVASIRVCEKQFVL